MTGILKWSVKIYFTFSYTAVILITMNLGFIFAVLQIELLNHNNAAYCKIQTTKDTKNSTNKHAW